MGLISYCVLGSQKLGFIISRLVLEEDGTEIEGDEELSAVSGKILMGLKQSEVW